MAAPENGASSADKTMKRFNNGHKTFTAPEAKFLTEIYANERKAASKFAHSIPTMRRPRDPTLGEDTPRFGLETTELYFPDSTFMQSDSKVSARTIDRTNNSLHTEFGTHLEMADSLNRQKQKLEEELRVVNKVLQHKRLILSMSTGTMGKINAANTFPTALPK
jgi:hypothetical protein